MRVISGKSTASKPNEEKVEVERHQRWRLDWLRSKKLTRPCLPTDAMPRNERMNRWTRYRCCIERERERQTSFFPDPAGTRELRYPPRYERDFFWVSLTFRHISAHRVGFCLPTRRWSMCNTLIAPRSLLLRFGDFPVGRRVILHPWHLKNSLTLKYSFISIYFYQIEYYYHKTALCVA